MIAVRRIVAMECARIRAMVQLVAKKATVVAENYYVVRANVKSTRASVVRVAIIVVDRVATTMAVDCAVVVASVLYPALDRSVRKMTTAVTRRR